MSPAPRFTARAFERSQDGANLGVWDRERARWARDPLGRKRAFVWLCDAIRAAAALNSRHAR